MDSLVLLVFPSQTVAEHVEKDWYEGDDLSQPAVQ